MGILKLLLSIWLMVSITTGSSLAQPYTPKNDDEVLLKLDSQQAQFIQQTFKPSSESQALALATKLLSTANQPGNSQQFQLAESLLAPFVAQSKDINLWYLWAQIKQHQHLFSIANEQLSRIFQLQPNHVAARLMSSRLALIQRESASAKQHCLALLGFVDVITTQICLLEVSSYQGQLDSSYEQLLALIQRWPVPESHQTWVTLMLVDMAMRKNDFSAADQHLEKYPAPNDSSYLTTWADVKTASQQAQLVKDKLVGMIKSGLVLEDGLMLRLALAEQQLNQQNNQVSEHWLDQLNQRIELLAQREEFMHANEMARYYLYLMPEKKQALYWAKLNWQDSKEHQDELLLHQAENFMDED